MTTLRSMIVFAVFTSSATTALAQNDPAKTPAMDPGTVAKNVPAASAPNAASGTLMQQRQEGMAPKGAAGGGSTGKMKQ